MRVGGKKEESFNALPDNPSNKRPLFPKKGRVGGKKEASQSILLRKHNPPMFSPSQKPYRLPSLRFPFISTYSYSFPLFSLGKCLEVFVTISRTRWDVRAWHFPSSCRAEGREPWVPPGYPQKSGFSQGSWTRF